MKELELYYKIKTLRSKLIAPVDIMGCYSVPSVVSKKEEKLYVLISLLLSSQTKDEINFQSMLNLISSKHLNINDHNKLKYKNVFTETRNYLEVELNNFKYLIANKEEFEKIIEKHLKNTTFGLKSILEMSIEELNRCISKVGFHNKKAVTIKNTCELISKEGYPKTLEECLKIKGFGLKMGLLYLNNFFKTEGISVDTHVHRIANRLGLVKTEKPEQTSKDLQKIFPLEEYKAINSVLVGFGQIICTAVKPKCERCCIKNECNFKNGW